MCTCNITPVTINIHIGHIGHARTDLTDPENVGRILELMELGQSACWGKSWVHHWPQPAPKTGQSCIPAPTSQSLNSRNTEWAAEPELKQNGGTQFLEPKKAVVAVRWRCFVKKTLYWSCILPGYLSATESQCDYLVVRWWWWWCTCSELSPTHHPRIYLYTIQCSVPKGELPLLTLDWTINN